jgi:excinuclease ABC subunit C
MREATLAQLEEVVPTQVAKSLYDVLHQEEDIEK